LWEALGRDVSGLLFLYTYLNSYTTGKDDSMGIKKLFGIYFGGYTADIFRDLFHLLRSIASCITKTRKQKGGNRPR